jgi:hypothetical protein
MSWSNDEVFSVYAGDSTTLQWKLIAEPLNYSYNYETVGALNLKADPLRERKDFKGLNSVCNELAGTTGLSAVAALRSIDL